jgi:hypothetical protein
VKAEVLRIETLLKASLSYNKKQLPPIEKINSELQVRGLGNSHAAKSARDQKAFGASCPNWERLSNCEQIKTLEAAKDA